MATATTSPDSAIRERLTAARAQLRDLRDEHRQAQGVLATKKDAFIALGDVASIETTEFRAAEQAAGRLREVEAQVQSAQDAERALLGLLGEGGGVRPRGQALDEPGGWLSAVAMENGLDGGGFMAALTTDDAGFGSRTDLGIPFSDRVSAVSALLASGPTVASIETTELKVPRLAGRLGPAPVVPELVPIPEADTPISEVDIRPPKVATLATISEEAWRDARPAVLAAHERELVRSVAAGFDVAAISGVAGDLNLPGILATTGTAAVDAANALTNLDPFAQAVTALRAVGAVANAFYMHPQTWGRLMRLKKTTTSNEPLVSAELVTEGPRESLLGVPVFMSEHMPQSKAVAAVAGELLVVRRTAVEVRVAENFKFAEAGVGVRVIFRAALVVPQPEAVAVISNLPTT